MKKTLQLLVFIGLAVRLDAQNSFSDDFESYPVGAFLGVSSPQWTTWTVGGEGSSEDVKIVDDLARSGQKSIYLKGVSGGGPQDIVLLFGERRTVGTMNFQMSMFIPNGRGAYLNFQGNVARGTGGIWVIEMYFDPGGAARLTLGTGGRANILTGNFPSNTWFEVKIVANLSDNNWEVFIDEQSLGSFSNPNNYLTSMNLYCVDQTHEFWVDDVSYHFEPFVPAQLDGAISGLSVRPRGLSGTQAPIAVKVKNLGQSAITNFDIAVRQHNGTPAVQAFSGLNIPPLAERTYLLDEKLTYKNGTNELIVSLLNVNGGDDEKPANNEKKLSVQGVSPAPYKRVLVEEATGTWCTWCPRGHVFMDSMARTYPDHFVGIAVHGGTTNNADPMQLIPYNNWIRAFPGFTGWPSAVVDRKIVIDPSALENALFDYVIESTPVILENGASYDSTSRVLKTTIKGQFLEDLNGDYRFNMILVEDRVRGNTSAYNQVNAYAGGANGPMGGFELLPNPVPFSRMVYNDVARYLFDGPAGQEGYLPNEIFSNSVHIKEYVYTIPPNFRYENLKLVGVLYGPGGEVVNAVETSIDEAIRNGLATDIKDVDFAPEVVVSPNPASSVAYLDIELNEAAEVELRIYDLVGQAISSRNYGQMSGSLYLPIQTSLLPKGAYIVQVRVGNTFKKTKLVVSH